MAEDDAEAQLPPELVRDELESALRLKTILSSTLTSDILDRLFPDSEEYQVDILGRRVRNEDA
jgi:hypothetical protein